MPIPQEISLAQKQFDRFLAEARDVLGHATRNQAYTTVQAVLVVFRRRLSPSHVLLFAGALPPILRAIFVQGWTEAAPVPFGDIDAMEREVRDWRKHHNFAPPAAIALVAKVLRTHVDPAEFDNALQLLPPEAEAFWRMDEAPG